MVIPKKFEFLGHKWQVIISDEPGKTNKRGVTHFEEMYIELGEDLPQDLLESTFVHELCHVIMHQMGLDRSLFNLDGDKEEEFVNTWSNGLYAMLKSIKLC